MKLRELLIASVGWVLISHVPMGLADPPGKESAERGQTPQAVVACTGWHALCSGSTDCQVNGDRVDCDCWRVNETHIVETSEIQDPAVKRRTERRCTDQHPCDLDEAPVCAAIASGEYAVDGERYPWVSTFSYRGWCELYEPKACDPSAPEYVGDTTWAICDAAPCTESADPADPDRPLSCQCRIRNGAFIGTKNSCTGDNGGIISAMPVDVWDFEQGTFTAPVPGYDYVQGACAPLTSDQLPAPKYR
jgi:hypothetical protein